MKTITGSLNTEKKKQEHVSGLDRELHSELHSELYRGLALELELELRYVSA